jgi:hypothetical protein
MGSRLSSIGKGFLGWFSRWLGWLLLTSFFTLGGAALLMLFKDWTIKSLFTSMMAWPALGLATIVAMFIALVPMGRFFFLTAFGSGLVYNLILLVS